MLVSLWNDPVHASASTKSDHRCEKSSRRDLIPTWTSLMLKKGLLTSFLLQLLLLMLLDALSLRCEHVLDETALTVSNIFPPKHCINRARENSLLQLESNYQRSIHHSVCIRCDHVFPLSSLLHSRRTKT